MSQQHETPPTGYERTEQVVNAIGSRIGLWAGRVVGRMQRAAGALNREADRMDTPGAEAQPHDQPAEHPTMMRAEVLVGRFGEYARHWTVDGNVRMRRALARLREDVEDMWAEAHEIERHQQSQPREQAPREETH